MTSNLVHTKLEYAQIRKNSLNKDFESIRIVKYQKPVKL